MTPAGGSGGCGDDCGGRPPRVSVMMNCRDAAATLPETLASLRAQTFRDFEVIFWDNASRDGSGDVARACAAGLPAFRYFYDPVPVRLGLARNAALAQARGEFIAFLDCDDLWLPEKLAAQTALLLACPAVGLVCTDTAQMLEGRRLRRTFFQWARPVRGMVFDELVARQWISMSSLMLRRTALDSVRTAAGWFDAALEICEDADLQYRIAYRWPCDHVDAALTVWRVHGGNATLRKFSLFAREGRYLLEKYRETLPDFATRHTAAATVLARRAAFREAVALWRGGKGGAARQALRGQSGAKAAALRAVTWLPSCCFGLVACLYWRWR